MYSDGDEKRRPPSKGSFTEANAEMVADFVKSLGIPEVTELPSGIYLFMMILLII
jgi:hypothetical protein